MRNYFQEEDWKDFSKMRLSKSFQLALNILLHSKLRSWLTIIGIVIGVAAIVAIVSIGEGAQANVNARLSGLGADIITVSPGFERASQYSFIEYTLLLSLIVLDIKL